MISKFLANGVSWIFNPAIFVVVMLGFGIGLSHSLSKRAMVYWFVALSFFSLVGMIILAISWLKGIVIDADLATPMNLLDRSRLLVIFVSLILLMLFASFQMDQPQPLHANLITILVLGLLVAGITYYWKISLHMLGVSTFLVAMMYSLDRDLFFWLGVFLIPLVTWARLVLHRHTPYQLTAGFLVGIFITRIVFQYYGLI